MFHFGLFNLTAVQTKGTVKQTHDRDRKLFFYEFQTEANVNIFYKMYN